MTLPLAPPPYGEKIGNVTWKKWFYKVREVVQSFVDSGQLTPVGTIVPYAGTTAPYGWLLCEGTTLNANGNRKYIPLFNVIGTTFGGTGINDFDLPDLRGRTVVGSEDFGTGSDATTFNGLEGTNATPADSMALSYIVKWKSVGPRIQPPPLDSEFGSTQWLHWLFLISSLVQDLNIANGGDQVGIITWWPTGTAPDGWSLCDATAYNTVTNPEYQPLYDLIGNTYGGSDNTDFEVPDLQALIAVGLDNLGGTSADRLTGTWADTLGGTGGNGGSNNAVLKLNAIIKISIQTCPVVFKSPGLITNGDPYTISGRYFGDSEGTLTLSSNTNCTGGTAQSITSWEDNKITFTAAGASGSGFPTKYLCLTRADGCPSTSVIPVIVGVFPVNYLLCARNKDYNELRYYPIVTNYTEDTAALAGSKDIISRAIALKDDLSVFGIHTPQGGSLYYYEIYPLTFDDDNGTISIGSMTCQETTTQTIVQPYIFETRSDCDGSGVDFSGARYLHEGEPSASTSEYLYISKGYWGESCTDCTISDDGDDKEHAGYEDPIIIEVESLMHAKTGSGDPLYGVEYDHAFREAIATSYWNEGLHDTGSGPDLYFSRMFYNSYQHHCDVPSYMFTFANYFFNGTYNDLEDNLSVSCYHLDDDDLVAGPFGRNKSIYLLPHDYDEDHEDRHWTVAGTNSTTGLLDWFGDPVVVFKNGNNLYVGFVGQTVSNPDSKNNYRAFYLNYYNLFYHWLQPGGSTGGGTPLRNMTGSDFPDVGGPVYGLVGTNLYRASSDQFTDYNLITDNDGDTVVHFYTFGCDSYGWYALVHTGTHTSGSSDGRTFSGNRKILVFNHGSNSPIDTIDTGDSNVVADYWCEVLNINRRP